MQSNNSSCNKVSPLENVPHKSDIQKTKTGNMKQNGSTCTATNYPDFLKSCKENIIARYHIDKKGQNYSKLSFVIFLFKKLR